MARRSSTTRFVILGVLAMAGPSTGYGIRRWIQASVGFFWAESYGQLYPELKALVAQGLVTTGAKATGAKRGKPRERTRYRLSPAGRRALGQWLEQPAQDPPVRVEHLLKLFFGRESGPGAARRHLEAVRAAQRARAGAFAAAEPQLLAADSASPDLVFSLIVLRAGRAVSAARLAWVEESLALLDAFERGGNAAVLARAEAR